MDSVQGDVELVRTISAFSKGANHSGQVHVDPRGLPQLGYTDSAYLCRAHECVVGGKGVGRGEAEAGCRRKCGWCWRERGGNSEEFGQRDQPAVENEERELTERRRCGARRAEAMCELRQQRDRPAEAVEVVCAELRQGCADRPAGVRGAAAGERGAAAPGHKTSQRRRMRRRLN
ncbi:hypothetical protein Syun_028109 [Stephania yunnanensis]|uniref:Uncharacterized protein n=1 Tax=Stephania yunnanensis TaxID=152371 RepID=A0AAP0EMB9_9MAGN